MARQMAPAEKRRFQAFFPNLDVNRAVVTGEMSAVYNCIAWTVGITNRWLWPGNSLANFDTFYRGFGFVRAADGTITAWGLSTSNLTHGSVSGPGHGPRWESKCGGDLRIQHGLNELVASSYGRVLAFYRRSGTLAAVFEAAREEIVTEKIAKSYLSASRRNAPSMKSWKGCPKSSELPSTRRSPPGKRPGSAADWRSAPTRIPGPLARSMTRSSLLVRQSCRLSSKKLADPENFFALQIYDALQSDEKLLVQFEPDDERILEGEQGRARRVVQAWFANK